MRGLGLVVLGLGFGLGIGYVATDNGATPALVWLGFGLVVLSTVLLALSPRRPRPAADPEKPALAGLGPRVEKILELAEEQAADKIRSAEEEAERIIARARQFPG